MLFNERAEIILQQVQLQSTVRVQELSELLQVSQDTVRRDLRAMEKRGLLKCVRGGACLPESLSAFSNFKGREIIHSDLKRAASRKAIGYIREGDIVALNSGTTNTILAQEIAQRCGYTDQHYFSYCFKKYSGTSPVALRRARAAGEARP